MQLAAKQFEDALVISTTFSGKVPINRQSRPFATTSIPDIYVEWCDQSMSGYDLIDQFILCRDAVEVIFKQEAEFYVLQASEHTQDKLTRLRIRIFLDEVAYQELKRRILETIFLNCKGYRVEDGARAV